jgi:outer membrane protein OmpA-like peptidoglycan-associated protein
MKKLILTCLILFGSLTASSQDFVSYSDITIHYNDTSKMLDINFELSVGSNVMKSSHALTIIPILQKSGREMKRLSPVLVSGRDARILHMRRVWKELEEEYPEGITRIKTGEKLHYYVSLAFEPWMLGAELVAVTQDTSDNIEESVLQAGQTLVEDITPPEILKKEEAEKTSKPETKAATAKTVNSKITPVKPEPRKTTGDKLATAKPYISRVSTDALDRILKSREETIALLDNTRNKLLKIGFATGRKTVDLRFGDNAATIEEIIANIDTLEASADSKVTGIVVVGFASPEGSNQLNLRLANERAGAVRTYLQGKTHINATRFKVVNGEINYEGLRELVAASNMKQRDAIIDIIDDVPAWDARRKIGRLGALKRLDGGEPYRYMLREYFPQLRVAAYIMVLYDNK